MDKKSRTPKAGNDAAIEGREWLTVGRIAVRLDMGRKEVRRLIRAGEFGEYMAVGGKGALRVRAALVREWERRKVVAA